MSTHLGWEPATPRPLGGTFGPTMADALAERCSNGNRSDLPGSVLGERDVDWLKGIRDVAMPQMRDEAVALLNAIAQHGEIKIVRA